MEAFIVPYIKLNENNVIIWQKGNPLKQNIANSEN